MIKKNQIIKFTKINWMVKCIKTIDVKFEKKKMVNFVKS